MFLVGEDSEHMRCTEMLLRDGCFCHTFRVDVCDEHAVRVLAAQVGSWNVLILAKTYRISSTPMHEASVKEWWTSFEVRSLRYVDSDP